MVSLIHKGRRLEFYFSFLWLALGKIGSSFYHVLLERLRGKRPEGREQREPLLLRPSFWGIFF